VAVHTQVVVVSDSHLSEKALEAERNWSAVVDYVDHLRPGLVVHVGDLSLDGQHDAKDLEYARAQLDRLSTTPWMAVPGNHDIGDNPIPGTDPDPKEIVNEENLARWTEVVGPHWWEHDLGGWQLVGVNAQLFGSGLSAEDEQWEWLEGVVATSKNRRRPVALVSHKPLQASDSELATAPAIRFVPQPARDRLRGLFDDIPANPLVLSGHVHQFRSLPHDGTFHVWAPTTWAILPDTWQASIGTKRCGVVHLALSDNGTSRHELVEPDGIRQLVIGEDTPDYYAH
jgi:3',5'-cyclic AMP phosphodiesterase CpdA